MLKGINIKKIESFLKKLPRVLAENAFPTLFGLIFLALILGAFVFYQFCFLPQRREIILEEEALEFKEELCQKFLEILDQREKRFEETKFKAYPDLFRPESPAESPELTE